MQSHAPSEPTVYGSPVREDDDVPPTPSGKPGRPRRNDPPWAKTLLIIGAVLMVVSGISGGVVVAGRIALSQLTKGIPQQKLIPDDIRAGKNINGELNILLLGLDERANSDMPIHTDSVIIVHIPASHDAVYMISLPRDTLVSVPAMFNHPASSHAKLTEVYRYGNEKNGKPDDSPDGRTRGVTATAKVINQLVPGGIKFNAISIVNFKGFQKLVNVLGGVHMCIDQVVESEHYDAQGNYHTSTRREGTSKYTYKIGCRDLKPWEALDYSRQRYGLPNADYDRQRHQQQLLKAIFAKLMTKGTLTDISKLKALRDAAGDLLTLDLDNVPMEDWLFSFKNMSASNVTMIKTNGGKFHSEYIDGVSYEVLSDDSKKLLKAVHDDKVYDFINDHPSWIAKEKK